MEAVRLIGNEVGTESVRLPGEEGRSEPTEPVGRAEVSTGRLEVVDRPSEIPELGTEGFGETRLTEMEETPG